MKKIILYIAASLNGKIADHNGDVDWLELIKNPDESDYGYSDFFKEIDTTIQGFSTYQQILDWDIEWPYPDKKNYVLTGKKDPKQDKNVSFINKNHLEEIKKLKDKKGGNIWLIGGGKTNAFFLQNMLIDEIRIFVMPVVLPSGIDIFETLSKHCLLDLIDSAQYTSDALELRYKPLYD